jgi:hypothetical protein
VLLPSGIAEWIDLLAVDELRRADFHAAVGGQAGFVDLLAVQVRAVAALQIADPPQPFDVFNDRMHARREWIRKHDVAIEPAANARGAIGRQNHVRPGPRAGNHQQIRIRNHKMPTLEEKTSCPHRRLL